MHTLWTVGHGLRTADQILAEIDANGVDELWDIRSRPQSRHNPKANKRYMMIVIGDRYSWHGETLGGMPSVGFDDPEYMTIFGEAREQLMDAVREGRKIAIMCAEGDANQCHRMGSITSILLELYPDEFVVHHIKPGGDIWVERPSSQRELI